MKKKNENLLVPQCLSNLVPMKRTAFTLAEVLITLGIIGVVATLTIPTLVRDYQKKTYVASFKKAHAELTEALKRMRAVERVETVTSTELYNARNDDSLWYGIFKKYMNISEFKKDITYLPLATDDTTIVGDSIQCSTAKCFQLQSGAVFMPNFYEPSDYDVMGIDIDVNGEKGPNRLGRDVFSLVVINDGRVYGAGQDYPCYEWACLGVELAHWALTCTWDKYKDMDNSPESYFKQSAIMQGGMSEEEFDREWGALSADERQSIIDDFVSSGDYMSTVEQMEQYKTLSKLGIGCTGRILEEGAMNY